MQRACHVRALAAAALALAVIAWGLPLSAADAPPAYCPHSPQPVDFSGAEGRINDEMLAAFRAMVARDPRTAPVTNAVTRNSVKDLRLCR